MTLMFRFRGLLCIRASSPISPRSSGQVQKSSHAMDLGSLRKNYRGDEEVRYLNVFQGFRLEKMLVSKGLAIA